MVIWGSKIGLWVDFNGEKFTLASKYGEGKASKPDAYGWTNHWKNYICRITIIVMIDF